MGTGEVSHARVRTGEVSQARVRTGDVSQARPGGLWGQVR